MRLVVTVERRPCTKSDIVPLRRFAVVAMQSKQEVIYDLSLCCAATAYRDGINNIPLSIYSPAAGSPASI